jgi:acetylornithine deacetylase/succinyl-diaminopimelate desuccinylase-like protein
MDALMNETDPVAARIHADRAFIRDVLATLVAIPSVSIDPTHDADVQRSADETAALFRESGCDTQVIGPEEHPTVCASTRGQGQTTVLLYAHHDVQPPGSVDSWSTPPFQLVEINGRLHGRGTADDKGAVAAHLATFRALSELTSATLKVWIEGDEEAGSPRLADLLERYRDLAAADVVIVADSNNWKPGVPAVTTTMRGEIDCRIEIRTLEHALHSGVFGGPLPDALTALAITLSRLFRDDGSVAVPGMTFEAGPRIEMGIEDFRRTAGVPRGLTLTGQGGLVERMWNHPAIAVIGIDAPTVERATNQLVPVARARICVRVSPGDDVLVVERALTDYIRSCVPWGATCGVETRIVSSSTKLASNGPVMQALDSAMLATWGQVPLRIGQGGSIPFVTEHRRLFPESSMLITGLADPLSNEHAENESLDVRDFERMCETQAKAIQALAYHGDPLNLD